MLLCGHLFPKSPGNRSPEADLAASGVRLARVASMGATAFQPWRAAAAIAVREIITIGSVTMLVLMTISLRGRTFQTVLPLVPPMNGPPRLLVEPGWHDSSAHCTIQTVIAASGESNLRPVFPTLAHARVGRLQLASDLRSLCPVC
jgi:hypothetical protein